MVHTFLKKKVWLKFCIMYVRVGEANIFSVKRFCAEHNPESWVVRYLSLSSLVLHSVYKIVGHFARITKLVGTPCQLRLTAPL